LGLPSGEAGAMMPLDALSLAFAAQANTLGILKFHA
jgi:hypothetical protein